MDDNSAPSSTGASPSSGSAAPSSPSGGSFSAALERASASDVASPATSTPDGSPASLSAPAPEAQAAAPAAPNQSIRSEHIPRARFDEVNSRREKAEAALKELEWARSLPSREYGEQGARLIQYLQQDPITALDHIARLVHNHPQHGPQLRALAGRILGGRQQAQAVEDPEPAPDLQTDTGRPVYSAEQAQKHAAWVQRQTLAKVKAELQPFHEAEQRRQVVQEGQRVIAESRQRAAATFGELSKLPKFAELKADIGKALQDHPEWGTDAYRAYVHVLQERVFPTIDHQAEQRVLSTLTQKAHAGTINPAATTGATPTRPSTFGEALRQQATAR